MNRERLGRSAASLLIAMLLTFFGAGSALAQPPANDTIDGATLITGDTALTEDTS